MSASGLPAAELAQQEAQFFGEDVWLNVAGDNGTGEASYLTTPAGDVQTVSGREALRQSLIRRIVTDPKEWPTLPNYGVGARRYVKAKNTPAVRAELEAKIRSQFARDPRVHTVDLVTMNQLEDGSPGIRISVLVTPRGRLRSDQPLSVDVEVR